MISNMTSPPHTGSPGPLAGLKVLEVGSMYAGPFCGQLLGDMGATVTKIEAPGKPDTLRTWSYADKDEVSFFWGHLSRNKRCITLDVSQPQGRDLFLRMAKDYDVIVENFRGGNMEKWGLGPEDVFAVNPRIIYARVSGFGQTGPYANKPGFGIIAECMSGLRSITGYPDLPPVRAGISIADAVGGMFTAFGVTSALHERQSSGRGQVIDTALYEGLFMLMNDFVAVYEALGVVKKPVGARNPRVVPTNIYKTKDGEYVVPAAGSDPVFKRIAAVMGRPDLAEKYGRAQVRADNEEVVDGEVASWIASHTAEEVLARMNTGDVPVAKVYRAPDILRDPQFKARDMLLPMEWPGIGTLHYPGIVPKLSRTPGSVRSVLPQMGQHNQEVYSQELGMSEAELASLSEAGVI